MQKNILIIALSITWIGIVGFGTWYYFQPNKAISPISQGHFYSPDQPTQNQIISLPKQLDFCGEPMPLQDIEVKMRLDREMHANVFKHSATFLILKRASLWFPEIEKILKEEGLPDDFKYLAVAESDLTNAISPAKATGFWQIMDFTAKEYGLEISEEIDERYNPIKSAKVACAYLKNAYQRYGSWTLAAASYNAGMGYVSKQVEEQKSKNYYDMHLYEETSRYVPRIIALKTIMQNPEFYGFKLEPEQFYQFGELKTIEVKQTIPDLVEFALANGSNYKNLRFYNPWIRGRSLTVKLGKTYQILLPKS